MVREGITVHRLINKDKHKHVGLFFDCAIRSQGYCYCVYCCSSMLVVVEWSLVSCSISMAFCGVISVP